MSFNSSLSVSAGDQSRGISPKGGPRHSNLPEKRNHHLSGLRVILNISSIKKTFFCVGDNIGFTPSAKPVKRL